MHTRAGASPNHADEDFAGYSDIVPVHAGLHSGVFHAREDVSGRPVALKVLTVDGVTPRGMESFARESAILAAISAHPNIVTLYRSYRLADGRPVLVLERCGGSLADWMRDGKRPATDQSVSIAIKIAGALETAHRGGVLHRDVRPANILLTEFGEPALSDFGVARLRSTAPAPAELFDFPSVHVAPELMMGSEASAATDVYGLASSLYELLAGQPPLAAYQGESPAATILRILRDPARPIVRDDVPIELSDLVLWGLAKDPADRPPSVMWFAEELGRIEAQNGWPRTRIMVREPERPVTAAPVRRHSVSVRPPGGRPVPPPAAPDQPVAGPPPAPPTAPPAADPATGADPAPLLATPVPAPGPPAWTLPPPQAPPPQAPPPQAPPPPMPSTARRPTSRRRVVLRAPLLSAGRAFLALMGPFWAVLAVVLALTAPSATVLAWTLGCAAALSALAGWFVRPSLQLDACHMQHRDGLARVLIPWDAVVSLQPRYEPSRRPGAPHGLIVVLGTHEAMPLTATRRSAWELADLVATLEAFRSAGAGADQIALQ
jgi:hypothetical protein